MQKKKPCVLIIATQKDHWYDLWKDYEDEFDMEQTCWDEFSIVTYTEPKMVLCSIAPSRNPNHERMTKERSCQPDFVVIRSL